MGKFKQKRSTKGRNNPTGLLSTEECVMLDESQDVLVGSTVSNLVEKLQHAHQEERHMAGLTIAGLVGEPGAVAQLMSANAVRILGPLMLDAHSCVRESALGALRNISVEGGIDVVRQMVRQDILTPLAAFFKEYGENWTVESTSEKQLQKDEKYMSFLQAVHLLLNACEASEAAVEIFNRERLLFLLLPCLSVSHYGIELATTVGQCLVTASDNNTDCCVLLGQDEMMSVLMEMLKTPHSNTRELHFKTIIAELVFSCVRSGSGEHADLESLTKVLKELLHKEIIDSITNAVQTISTSEGHSAMDSNSASAMDSNTVESTEEKTPSKETAAILKDLTDACMAQQVGLELLSNMCALGEEEDDEQWEDVASIGSEEDPMEAEAGAQDVPLNQESVTEIMTTCQKHDIISQVFSLVSALCSFDSMTLLSNSQLKKLAVCVSDLKRTGLLCINNLVSSGDVVISQEMLGSFWRQISQMAALQNVQNEEDLMEAVMSAMRAAAGKLAENNSSVFLSMTPEDMQFISTLALQCPSSEVQANAIRIIATIGTVMVKTNPTNSLLKDIGILLEQCANSDKELWVIAESLDAVLDVFGPDETDPILKEIGLIAKLKILAPVLKRKAQQTRPSKEHQPVISTVRMNLTRFIKYKAHTMT